MAEPTEDHDVDGDDSPEPAPAKPSRLERLLSPTAAPTKAVAAANSGATTKWSVDRLDGRERLYGYGSGAMAVVFAFLIYLVESNNKHLKLARGQFSPTTTLIVGITCGLLLVATTRIGRRALVGFVAMFTFLAFQPSSILIGLPFLILAVWLLYRSYKVQKASTDRMKADRAAGIAPTKDRQTRATAKERADARRKGPPVPEGNKRYTPKKPTPPPVPAPKPSWRERRAAKTSD